MIFDRKIIVYNSLENYKEDLEGKENFLSFLNINCYN